MKIASSEIEILAQTATLADETKEVASGAQMVVRALIAEGVDTVWGCPGGAVLPINDALEETTQIDHLLVRHEQGAVHAADGYARATGKVGVALVTSGPGVTNAVTGIATAYFDSIPVVVVSANVPTDSIGHDAFQERDTVGITRSIVKHNFLVQNVDELPTVMKKAFYIASTGRPGPVMVDISKDILLTEGAFLYPESASIRSYKPRTEGHGGQIKQAAEVIASARKPYIYAGGGAIAAHADTELHALANLIGVPVTTTLMGLGVFCDTDLRFLGMPGMHGTYEANMATQHCDVLIAVGVRFDDRVIGNIDDFAAGKRTIIHVDIDPASIDKRVNVDVPIVGDVKCVLRVLISTGGFKSETQQGANEWKLRLSKRSQAYVRRPRMANEMHG